MVDEKFEGKKFRVVDVIEKRREDIWWKEVYEEVPVFKMTKQYKKWIYEKKKQEARLYLEALKSKLNYQHKTYGEVDKIDFDEYAYKLKEYQRNYVD